MIFKLFVSKPGGHFLKEVLLDTLWPHEDPEMASGKLHIAISRLRRALEKAGLWKDVLIFENDAYRLHDNLKIESDLANFDRHFNEGSIHLSKSALEIAAAEFERALEFYQGPYLTEVVGEDWPLLERMRLEEQYLILLTWLATWYYERGKFTDAAQLCRKVLAVDDLREDIYRLLMRCLVREGHRTSALRLHQDLERLLQKELGVQPMKVTQELAARIRSEEVI